MKDAILGTDQEFKQKSIELLKKYVGKNKLKVVKFRQRSNGGWVFGVYVAYQGEVVEVTNYFANAHDLPLSQRCGNWEIRANPGYDLEHWANDF